MADGKLYQHLIEIVAKGGAIPEQVEKDMRDLADEAQRLGVVLKEDTNKPLRDLEQRAKKAGLAVDKAGKQAKPAQTSFAKLGQTVGAFVGATAIAAFVRQSVLMEAQVSRSYSAIGKMMQSLGMDVEANIPRVERFAVALERATGVMEQDTLPVFQKFLGITKNVDGAMAATSLAADLVGAGLGDLGTNGERLANLLQGEVTEAAKSLGLQLRNENGTVKTQVQLLDELIATYDGFAAKQDDTQAKVESMGSAWNRITRSMGKAFAPIVAVIADGFQYIGRGIETTIAGVQNLVGQLSGVPKLLGSVFDIKKLIRKGPAAWKIAVAKAAEEAGAAATESSARFAERMADIWKDSADEAEQTEEQKQAGLAAIRDIAMAKQREAETKAARERAVKVAEAEAAGIEAGSAARLEADLRVIELRKQAAIAAAREAGLDELMVAAEFEAQKASLRAQYDQQLLAANKAIHDQLLQQQVAAAEVGSQERLDAELALLDRQRSQAVDQARKIGADVWAVEEAFRLAKLERIRQFDEQLAAQQAQAAIDRMAAEADAADARYAADLETFAMYDMAKFDVMRARLEEQLKAERELLEARQAAELDQQGLSDDTRRDMKKKHDAQLIALDARAGQARMQLAAQEQEQKVAMYANAAQQIIGSLQAIFGESKAGAIAAAIINTFQGATKAIADWGYPLGPVFAALTVAAGLKQVQRIRDTDMKKGAGGAGFDDPRNDALAYTGGRLWAADVVGLLSAGFRDGLQDMVVTGAGTMNQTSVDQSDRSVNQSETFNFHGPVLGTRLAMRRLARDIQRAKRQDKGRTL